ncbi:Clp protease N-terminal domain-containing protein [Fimbriiglobus ruber]|nr:Clp protease N-terminal domain-containing protein [Fimbriiglobus ruber]
MDYSRFTDRGRKVMHLAAYHAHKLGHKSIDTEHLLLGMLSEGAGVAGSVLKNLGVESESIAKMIRRNVDIVPSNERTVPGRLPLMMRIKEAIGHAFGRTAPGHSPLSPRVKEMIEYAREEATGLHHLYIGTEHLLLGLVRVKNEPNIAAEILESLHGVTPDAVRKEVMTILVPEVKKA